MLEDLHWADEATLDLVRLLARRIEGAPALIVVTYRDAELGRAHPLRLALGELARESVTRIGLKPLSPGAVESLARPYGVDPSELHGRTSGNPFYVTEALAAGGAALPASVREAVLARAARLPDGARTLLEAAAIVPPRTELWLLEAIAAGDLEHLEACLSAGMLRAEGDRVAFRHEIARVAIEDTLLPDRRIALHRRALAALTAPAGRRADPARLAHHAEAAGDVGAVLEFAPAAAERAAEIGAHREAAAQLARALRVADALPADERARLLERRAYECYLTDAIPEAIEARRGALAEHRARGDRLREGDTRRWLSRLAWFAGDNATAETEARAAVELLEALPVGPELAMAYSNMSQLRMLSGDVAAAVGWGARAIELAEQHDAVDVLAHALNNVGTAELGSGTAEGAVKLARSLELALEAGLEEHVARAFTNLATTSLQQRNYAVADEHLAAGIDYCLDHDLDSWLLYMTGWQARSHLEQGRWDAAGEAARAVLSRPGAAATSARPSTTTSRRSSASCRSAHAPRPPPRQDASACARGPRRPRRSRTTCARLQGRRAPLWSATESRTERTHRSSPSTPATRSPTARAGRSARSSSTRFSTPPGRATRAASAGPTCTSTGGTWTRSPSSRASSGFASARAGSPCTLRRARSCSCRRTSCTGSTTTRPRGPGGSTSTHRAPGSSPPGEEGSSGD